MILALDKAGLIAECGLVVLIARIRQYWNPGYSLHEILAEVIWRYGVSPLASNEP